MAKSELIVGLDIGTTKTCAVVGELVDDDIINITGLGECASTGLRKGVIVNIEQTLKSIRQALEGAENMADVEIRSVYVGIAGSHIASYDSDGVVAIKNGEVEIRDVDRVIEAARAIAMPTDRDVIHILPQEYIIDDQREIIDPLGMSGVRLEVKVHIVTGAVSSIQNIERACDKAGLDVSGIVLKALASSKAILTQDERELGVAIVDIGGATSDIVIFANDVVKHTAVVALGGQSLTNDIAFALRTSAQAAERMKEKYGSALVSAVQEDEFLEVPSVGGRGPTQMPRTLLAEICEPRMEEILRLIDSELEKSGYKDRIGAGIVLTGGAALLKGCVELAAQIFNLPVRLGIPQNVGGIKGIVNSPKYATAVGLVRYGAEKEIREQTTRVREEEEKEKINSLGIDSLFARIKKWLSEVI